MDVIIGMIVVWLGWLIFAGMAFGLGCLVLRILANPSARWRFSTAFWCGFALLVFILQISNLFSGIGPRSSASLITIGFCSLIIHRSRFVLVRAFPLRQVILLIVALVWLSNRALQAPLLDDSGIYHFSSIRWANQMPLPPGLGNLHGRLAFNQSYFLYVAFLNNFPVPGFGHNLANSFLLAAGILTVLETSAANQTGKIFEDLLRLSVPIILFFAATCYRSNPPFIASPSPDAAVFVVEIVLIAFLIDFLSCLGNPDIDLSTVFVAIVCIISVSICLKLSSLAFAGSILVFVIALSARSEILSGAADMARLRQTRSDATIKAPPQIWPTKKPILLYGFAAMFGMIWLTRGIIASGYLLYPLPDTGLPLDWKIPEHLVRDELNGIHGWARLPLFHSYQSIGPWDWIPQWSIRMANRPDVVAPIGLICICLLFRAFFARPKLRQTSGGSSTEHLKILLGVGLVSVAFWFWNAPDPRFLGAALWLVVLAIVGLALNGTSPAKRLTVSRAVAFLLWVAVLLCLLRNGLGLTISSDGKLAQSIPLSALEALRTRSGLVVYTPLPGGYCWNGPLPCTPVFRPQLRLRGDSLAKGFSIDESVDRAPDF
jgi:hypothetical protein